ncbi:YqaA family protein [Brevibacillus daliensis]|uniref:YqaA family protein n=1 Tax=Brevibacillus daliensis TaxID=2892995 RepID=UPI001E3909C8|nr:VTT domain-containing protein [Brevibacillus daliensis]
MLETINHFFQEYGVWGLFSLAFLDSFILPFPPFFLQIALSLLDPSSALIFATYAFMGSFLGAPFGYLLGKKLGKPLMHKVIPNKWMKTAEEKMLKNGDAFIIIGSFTPIPFKVITIMSGVFNFSFARLMLYVFLGRGSKFFLIGFAFYLFGEQAKIILDQYLNLGLFGFGALLAVSYMIWRYINIKKSASNTDARSE